MKPNRWRAVRLRDAVSVAHLNELFLEGWFLLELGIADLPNLSFTVPLAPTPREYDDPSFITRRPESIQVVVLTRGSRKRLQRAVVQSRVGGVLLLGESIDARRWKALTSLPMEDGGIAVIYQRRGAEQPRV